MTNNQTKTHIIDDVETTLEKQEHYLDSFIDTGSEQQLFIASYIHGHYSVVSANFMHTLEQQPRDFFSSIACDELVNEFQARLTHAITQAINNQELQESDAIEVLNMLEKIFSVN